MSSIYKQQKQNLINRMIRINHAGELAAQKIYQGQLLTIDNEQKPIIKEMLESEELHLSYFTQQIKQRRCRPSLLLPVVDKIAFSLGYLTAKTSSNSAMACTMAVEEIIAKHYAEQICQLTDKEPDLTSTITQYKQEEEQHSDIAIKHNGNKAFAYALQSNIIKKACQFAIKLVTYL